MVDPVTNAPIERGKWFTAQPVFFACMAFCAGTIFAEECWRPDVWWLLVVAFALLAGAYFCWRVDRAILAAIFSLLTFFAVGALDTQLEQFTKDPQPDITAFTQGDEVIITAHITRNGLLRNFGIQRNKN